MDWCCTKVHEGPGRAGAAGQGVAHQAAHLHISQHLRSQGGIGRHESRRNPWRGSTLRIWGSWAALHCLSPPHQSQERSGSAAGGGGGRQAAGRQGRAHLPDAPQARQLTEELPKLRAGQAGRQAAGGRSWNVSESLLADYLDSRDIILLCSQGGMEAPTSSAADEGRYGGRRGHSCNCAGPAPPGSSHLPLCKHVCACSPNPSSLRCAEQPALLSAPALRSPPPPLACCCIAGPWRSTASSRASKSYPGSARTSSVSI